MKNFIKLGLILVISLLNSACNSGSGGGNTTTHHAPGMGNPNGGSQIPDNFVYFYLGNGVGSLDVKYISDISTGSTGVLTAAENEYHSILSVNFPSTRPSKSSNIAGQFLSAVGSTKLMTARTTKDTHPGKLFFYITTYLYINGLPIVDNNNQPVNFYIAEGEAFWGDNNWWVGSKFAEYDSTNKHSGTNILKVHTSEANYYICVYNDDFNKFYLTKNYSDCEKKDIPQFYYNKFKIQVESSGLNNLSLQLDTQHGFPSNTSAYVYNNEINFMRVVVQAQDQPSLSSSLADDFVNAVSTGAMTAITAWDSKKPSELYYYLSANLYMNNLPIMDAATSQPIVLYFGGGHAPFDNKNNWWVGSKNATYAPFKTDYQYPVLYFKTSENKEFYICMPYEEGYRTFILTSDSEICKQQHE